MKIIQQRATELDENGWRQPAVGICNHCGTEVHLASATNDCDECGTTYNIVGQEYRRDWRDMRDDGMDI